MKQLIDLSIDPSEYDLGELRRGQNNGFVYPRADGQRVERQTGSGGTNDAVLRAAHYRQLLLLQGGAPGQDLEKPYLRGLPTTVDGERTVFEWLEYLAEKGGFKRTHDALRHYRSLGWLTDAVENGLGRYLAGVPEPSSAETAPFDQSDHLLSLIYIGRLASTMDSIGAE